MNYDSATVVEPERTIGLFARRITARIPSPARCVGEMSNHYLIRSLDGPTLMLENRRKQTLNMNITY
jgi:hypothetical protein